MLIKYYVMSIMILILKLKQNKYLIEYNIQRSGWVLFNNFFYKIRNYKLLGCLKFNLYPIY
jgi:hypothetical protein